MPASDLLLIDPEFVELVLQLHPELRHMDETSTIDLPYSLSAALRPETNLGWLAVYCARAVHFDVTGGRTYIPPVAGLAAQPCPLSPKVFEELAVVLAYGREKHGMETWKAYNTYGLEGLRGKLVKHLLSRALGQKRNPEKQELFHSAQALAKTMFLWWHWNQSQQDTAPRFSIDVKL